MLKYNANLVSESTISRLSSFNALPMRHGQWNRENVGFYQIIVTGLIVKQSA
jgi:hypothetical protein